MEQHHELWLTALFNQFLAGPANSFLALVGMSAGDPANPWKNWIVMLIFTVLLMMVLAALLRPRLSVDKPGKVQLAFEAMYGFLRQQSHDIVGHGYEKYVPMFATFFFFILIGNLLGIIPTFESPTMYYVVPAGIALISFGYYNVMGVKAQGFVGHLKHFAGPLWWLAWFMFPLEIISHSIRPVSLTIRLYANMFAGEQVTLGFLALAPWVVPVVFMGLHAFVSFVQAFIFTMLSMVYVGMAVAHEEH
jgi:F-type H+-transporting ATPase subunit a